MRKIAIGLIAMASCFVFACVASAAEEYKPCHSVRPDGSLPNVNEIRSEIEKNYGIEYANKVVELLKILDNSRNMQPVPKGQALRVEFDVFYAKAIDGYRIVRSVANDLVAANRRVPTLKSRVDRYKVRLKATRPCYVYVWQMDSTGRVDPLFPNPEVSMDITNPIEPNVTYFVPPRSYWAILDENRGIEKIYLFVSLHPRPDVDKLSKWLANASRLIREGKWTKPNDLLKNPPPQIALNPVGEHMITTRGFGGVQKGGQITMNIDNAITVSAPTSVYEMSFTEMVQTLWFKHE